MGWLSLCHGRGSLPASAPQIRTASCILQQQLRHLGAVGASGRGAQAALGQAEAWLPQQAPAAGALQPCTPADLSSALCQAATQSRRSCNSLTPDTLWNFHVGALSASAAMHLKWSPCCKLVRLDCCTQPTCRCVLQFILTVELVRVGTFAMLPNASLTPRSLIPLEGDVSEREELSKISGLMIYVCHAQHLCTPCLWRIYLCALPRLRSSECLRLQARGQDGTPVSAGLSVCEACRGRIAHRCQHMQIWVCWCCRSGSTLWIRSGKCVSKLMPRLLSCWTRLQSSRPGPSARSGTLALSAVCHAVWKPWSRLATSLRMPAALDTCVLPTQSLSSTLTHTSICSTAPLSLHKQSCSLTRQGQRLLLLFIAATAGAIAGAGARHWIEAWPASFCSLLLHEG